MIQQLLLVLSPAQSCRLFSPRHIGKYMIYTFENAQWRKNPIPAQSCRLFSPRHITFILAKKWFTHLKMHSEEKIPSPPNPADSFLRHGTFMTDNDTCDNDSHCTHVCRPFSPRHGTFMRHDAHSLQDTATVASAQPLPILQTLLSQTYWQIYDLHIWKCIVEKKFPFPPNPADCSLRHILSAGFHGIFQAFGKTNSMSYKSMMIFPNSIFNPKSILVTLFFANLMSVSLPNPCIQHFIQFVPIMGHKEKPESTLFFVPI